MILKFQNLVLLQPHKLFPLIHLRAEALYMGKKLLVMPMQGQFEQQCNAAALEKMGVRVIKCLHKNNIPLVREWIESNERVTVNYPDITESIVSNVIGKHILNQSCNLKLI